MSLDVRRIAASLRVLAAAFEDDYQSGPVALATNPPAATPAPRGRGRPPKAEAAPAVAPAASPAAVAEVDPFAPVAAAAAPTATIEEVRAALTKLKEATTQENALAVLKSAGSADNLAALKPEKYGDVVTSCKMRMPQPTAVPPAPEDPFALPAATAEKPPTIEDVRAAALDAQKRGGIDRAKSVVMEHGGKKANPDGSGMQVSFNELPAAQFAATIAALKALPTTK